MLEKSDSSNHLPPKWMVSEAARDVVRRRLSCVPGFTALVQTTADKVQQYLEWNKDYAILAFYPPSEANRVGGRIRSFGQGFPGLFNINGEPRAHDIRPSARNARRFTGWLKIERRGPLLISKKGDRVVLAGDCVFQIEPDASIKIANCFIKSGKYAHKVFKYPIYFAYIAAFGQTLSPFNFLEYFESELIFHFGMGDISAGRQEIFEDKFVEATMA